MFSLVMHATAPVVLIIARRAAIILIRSITPSPYYSDSLFCMADTMHSNDVIVLCTPCLSYNALAVQTRCVKQMGLVYFPKSHKTLKALIKFPLGSIHTEYMHHR